MIVRDINFEKDYEVLATWWTKQGWPALPEHMLGAHGFVAEEDTLLAATWILPTGISIVLMEWTVGNPDTAWEKRAKAINMVTDHACKWAKENLEAKSVITMTKNERLIQKLEQNGFQTTDTGMTHLIRRV